MDSSKETMMPRTTVLIAVSVAFFGGAVWAEDLKIVPAGPPKPDAFARTGVESKVGIAWDCNMKNKAPIISVRADHGTVVVREILGPACAEQNVRQAGIFYKSEPSFKGEDKVYINGFLATGRLNSILRVQVN
jgi:hypothetical protein